MPLVKKLHLASADLRRQASVYNTCLDTFFFQTSRHIQHRFFGKYDECIAGKNTFREGKWRVLTDERSFALIPADGKAVAAQMDQVCDSRFSGGTHADMDFVGFQSQNRLCPAMPAVWIGGQLRLINHGNIVFLGEICHLDRRSCDPAVIVGDTLLTGQHGAGNAAVVHFFIYLKRQKAQRTEVSALFRCF